jgi:hypothetical protein
MLTYADVCSKRCCQRVRQYVHLPCVSMRQHTSAYVSIRQHTSAFVRGVHSYALMLAARPSVCVSSPAIPPHALAYASNVSYAYVTHALALSIRPHASAYVRMRQHTSAYVSIQRHTSAYAMPTCCCARACDTSSPTRSAATAHAAYSIQWHTSAYAMRHTSAYALR